MGIYGDDEVIYAADVWRSNADLIAGVAKMGYIKSPTYDATFGRGGWWKVWEPEHLVKATNGDGCPDLYADFRQAPFKDNTFATTAYDPPYVAAGGRTTTGIPDFFDRYGMDDAPRTPRELQRLINDGLTEMARITSETLLVKCQDYVSSGKLWLGSYHTIAHALKLGCVVVDTFDHLSPAPRPQPKNRTRQCKGCQGASCDACSGGRVASPQVHARRNFSTLLVLKPPASVRPVPQRT